jgi:hypothetical protein
MFLITMFLIIAFVNTHILTHLTIISTKAFFAFEFCIQNSGIHEVWLNPSLPLLHTIPKTPYHSSGCAHGFSSKEACGLLANIVSHSGSQQRILGGAKTFLDLFALILASKGLKPGFPHPAIPKLPYQVEPTYVYALSQFTHGFTIKSHTLTRNLLSHTHRHTHL